MKVDGARRDRPFALSWPGSRNGGFARGSDMRLQELAVEADPVAQLIVDHDRTVVTVNERARVMFGIAPHDIGRPIQDLEISYRPLELRSLLDRALQEGREIRVRDTEFTTPAGDKLFLDTTLTPLIDKDELLGIKVTFRDVTHYRQLQEDLKRSNQELETAYEELQSTNEELETTNEELQSTIEELETTNEELQSTNEELETMNEELQATNDELHGVNVELRARGEDLNRANTFLESILTALDEAVIVIDRELRVHAWNARSFEMWGLRPEEVFGRHILNLDFGLPVEQLVHVIRACLTADVDQTAVTVSALTRRGRTISVRVTCSTLVLGPAKERGVILLMSETPQAVERADG
jgi:two-component system, chemotaxis family, CheB/CheR fusion protein